MNRRHPTTPHAPADLQARWRDLPRHAALLQRRLGPPARTHASRAAGTALWLLQLTYAHAQGRLLAHGGAVLTVRGPAIALTRALAAAAVLLLAEVLLITALLLPTVLGAAATAAGAPAPWTRWGATAVTILFAALLLAGLARQLAAVWPARAVDACRRARLRTGGTWWTVGNLACREDDRVSAAYLVHAALAYADDHDVGAVITARTPALHRTYRRYGFTPDPDHPPAMVRPALGHRANPIALPSASRAARLIQCRLARPLRRGPKQARR
ncbi:hypothetical protein [Streptomyces sp. S1D4-20]|uniref:hypothetical protein n=1 Tax=Streptomyces sp. S1D4-20 TaxID=2594462 RepID=UPI0011635FE6|nr:hypothetical protein [Streptomyces sp. S1D4-20]QDN54044.1 hypothetical protein FNV67_00240 [Streptomyces sp. S1D4-20]